MTKRFQSSDMAALRVALRRCLENFDPQYRLKVGDIRWYDDHCWADVQIKFSPDHSLVGAKKDGYKVVSVLEGQKKPYVLRKGGREFVAGAKVVENTFGRRK